MTCRGALLLYAVLLPVAAHAQDFKRVQPKLPPPSETPTIKVPPEAVPPAETGRVLVPELKGLVFVNGMNAIEAGGIAPDAVPDGIAIRGLPLLDNADFAASLRPFLGRPLTQADLDSIGRQARELYRAREHPFVNVSVPPQNVQSGVVQLVVTEYRLGEVTVTGNRHFSSGLIRSMGNLESGETLTTPRLRRALEDYNQNPFLTVSAIAKPGSETGLTDIELQARDRVPWRVYGGYDNQGVPTLDRDEWYVGFNWGNVFGLGQTLSYQYTRAFNGRYSSHSASYIVPVDPDNRLIFFDAYATQQPRIAPIFRSEGHSGQISGRWAVDLPEWDRIRHSLQLGIDYKRTDNNLEFAGFRILDTAVEIFQFPLIYAASMPDGAGETALENRLIWSPGNITKYNTDEAMRQFVPGSSASYVYDRLSLTRTTRLGDGFNWIVRGMLQVSNHNLPYSEQIGGGGIGGVRGYDTNIALGSEGAMFTTELRSPAFSFFGGNDPGSIRDQFQAGIFVDYAYLRQRTRFADLPRDTQLASVGLSLHYTIERYLDLQLEIGQQLKRAPFAQDKAAQVAVVATISF